eukprot:TRINITY_DN9777_c0_g1_i3.p2 TRINITY_DN9777_c0_g1~~TRINITY_DN9777_c0_g1_i3.p2  ORF type:complete len:168 (+),score=41.74 TRINITY_DN9777_c0_g1_i3:310-813(+)
MQSKILPSWLLPPLTSFYFYPMMVPNYLFTRLCKPGNYYDQISPKVWMGAVPVGFAGVPEALRAEGITAVVNLMHEYSGPLQAYDRLGMQQLYLPVVDHLEPKISELRSAVSFISERVAAGEGVYVHLSLIHISEPTRLLSISYAVFCLKKKKQKTYSSYTSPRSLK